MEFIKTKIEGLLLIKPDVWKDDRGYFFESYQAERYAEQGIDKVFVQDNEAFSGKNVLRGLHYQLPPYDQDKLVRVVKGTIIDVAVDIRPHSPTYGEYHSVVLSEENKYQFFVPVGFAHGYVCLTDEVIFAYKCSNYYAKEHEGGIRFDDPAINIDWHINLDDAIVSERDKNLPPFGDHIPWSA